MVSDALDPDVAALIESVPDETQRADCLRLIDLMKKHSGKPARLFGSGMIGFGKVRYKYPTGTTGVTFLTGFAPRKSNLTLYVLWYQADDDPLLAELGKHKRGKGCLYINKLADVDEAVLDKIIKRSATELDGRFITEHLED